MTGPRFTIANVGGIILACAIALAALRYASPAWAAALVLLAAALLLTAVLAAILGPARHAALGFALFGGGFVLLIGAFALIDHFDSNMRGRTSSPVARGLDSIYPLIGFSTSTAEDFRAVGHALICLIFGVAGMLVARALVSHRDAVEGRPLPGAGRGEAASTRHGSLQL